MNTLYNLVTGPLCWAAFLIFIGGSAYKLFNMFRTARKKDNVVFEYWSSSHAINSILHWITPFATTNWRRNPLMTIATFAFHICLFFVPLFLFAHVALWKEYFNISWWTMSDSTADTMTLIVITACAFFLYRRLSRDDVKYLTSRSDYLILAIVVAPFITGYWTHQQWIGHRLMFILHILSGEIMLAAIPFTRLSHMIYAVFTRGYIGSEFGAVRHAKDW